jgi:hypothetical protein
MWTCSKCSRQFAKTNQSHSCRIFPLKKHFEGKPNGKILYDKLIRSIETNIGPFKVDSVECCIHLTKHSTFAAVKVFKDKLRIDFTLPEKKESVRFIDSLQMSAHRYLYYVDISSGEEIDKELIKWLNEAYEEKNVTANLRSLTKKSN